MQGISIAMSNTELKTTGYMILALAQIARSISIRAVHTQAECEPGVQADIHRHRVLLNAER